MIKHPKEAPIMPDQDWKPSINAAAKATSYEHYLELMAEAERELNEHHETGKGMGGTP